VRYAGDLLSEDVRHKPLLPLARQVIGLARRKEEQPDDERDGHRPGGENWQKDARGKPPIALTNAGHAATWRSVFSIFERIGERRLWIGGTWNVG
jgi:hypothetical protein